MFSNSENNRLRRARTAARRQGYRVWSVDYRTRWAVQYGPYALVDASTTLLAAWGMDIGELEKCLDE